MRLIAIPPDCRDGEELQTRTLFEKCLGLTFTVVGAETVDGPPHQLARLDVGHVIGKASYLETIWVETEYLQVESPN